MVPIPGTEFLGDTGLTDNNNPFSILGVAPDKTFLNAGRGADHEPSDNGQWGVALRYLAEELGDTEFGFYYLNYHSRLPVVAGHTGTVQGAQAGLQRAGAIAAAAPAAIQAIVTQAVTAALTQAGCPSPTASPQCGQVAATAQARGARSGGDANRRPCRSRGSRRRYRRLRQDRALYFVAYPEDVQLLGFSFKHRRSGRRAGRSRANTP